MAEDTVQHAPRALVRERRWRGRGAGVRAGIERSIRIRGVSDEPGRSRARGRDALYRRMLVGADSLAALVALYAAVTIAGDDELRLTSLFAAPLAVFASKLMGLYDRDELLLRKTTLEESPELFQLATLYTLLVWLLAPVLVVGDLGNRQILGLWASLFVGALVARALARGGARMVALPERCLVVGDLAGTGIIGRKLRAGGGGINAELVSEIPMDLEEDHEAELRVLEMVILEHDIHRVILAPRVADSDAMLDAIRLVKSMGVKVSLLPRLFEVVGSSVVFDDLNGVTVLGVRRFGLSRSSRWVKRGMDILGAGLGVVAVAPVLLMTAIAIRLESHGPIFFRQVRVGRDDKTFEMLKFRTMVDGADALKAGLRERNETEGLFKIADDPRITRVGRVLRKTSLDELPQLLNVLRGDMSLVGPRPLVLDEDRMVQGWHRRRLQLTPGMTGHWQILGSTRIPLHEMVKIDYLYIANWTLWSDVKIMLRTVPYMLRGGSM